MSCEWIKMRCDLGDDPAVVMMAAALRISEDEVVGKLHRLWSWADSHTRGHAPGVPHRWVDRYVGKAGFAEAMRKAGWLVFTADGIEFPNFDRHNGRTGKERAQAALRQKLSRSRRDENVTTPLPTKEKKRKEEESPLPPFPKNLDTPEFRSAWARWRAYHEEKGKPLTPTTVGLQLNELSGWGSARGAAAIDHTIARNWTGIREPEPGATAANDDTAARLKRIDAEMARRKEEGKNRLPASQVKAILAGVGGGGG